jgi:hypothetical protein
MPLGDSVGGSEASAGDARECLRRGPDSDPEIGIAPSLTEEAARALGVRLTAQLRKQLLRVAGPHQAA